MIVRCSWFVVRVVPVFNDHERRRKYMKRVTTKHTKHTKQDEKRNRERTTTHEPRPTNYERRTTNKKGVTIKCKRKQDR